MFVNKTGTVSVSQTATNEISVGPQMDANTQDTTTTITSNKRRNSKQNWNGSTHNTKPQKSTEAFAFWSLMTVLFAVTTAPKNVLFFLIMITFCIHTTDAQCNVAYITYIGDGYCDTTGGYNTLECGWDGGDCCALSCVDGDEYECGDNGYDCLDPAPQSMSPTSSPTSNPTGTTFYTGSWITSAETVPTGLLNNGWFIPGGYWNGTVYLFGGVSSPTWFAEYYIATDTAVTGTTSDSYPVYGVGQFYTQQQNKIFLIASGFWVNYLSVFDMSKKTFITNYVTLRYSVCSGTNQYVNTGCLASTAELLYVVGGMDFSGMFPLDYLQILELETLSWQEDGPTLITARRDAACIVSNNGYLFAIGGKGLDTGGGVDEYIYANERINIQNIISNEWQEFGELLVGITGHRAVIYGADILVIGGQTSLSMQIVNTFTGSVDSGPSMNVPVLAAAVVLVQERIYAFGGMSASDEFVDTIQYYILPETSAPTSAPSNSPTSLTTSPTLFPTESPTSTTTAPSLAPSNAPSLAPSQAPTDSTNAPSYSPSVAPSQSPSFSPSQSPSMNPSTTPSQAPSFSPSQPPSMHPTPSPTMATNNPTKSPTNNPTLSFTSSPSRKPTKPPTEITRYPTSSPTISPTISPTEAPTISAETMQYLHDVNELETLYETLLTIFALAFVIIAGLAWIDSHQKCRTNDYFKINQLSGAAFQSLDMLSDCFFAVNVSMQSQMESAYFIILLFSIIFIIIPASLTIAQLYYQSKKHWIYSSDKVRGWMENRAKALYLLSMITGNAFSAVSLVNSYMFQLSFFDMGLTDKELSAFMYKRVYTVILFENIPQLAIQTWYLISFGAFDDPITISSIIFSTVSIIVSVLSMSVQKSLSQTEGHVAVIMHIKGDVVMSKVKHCKTMKKTLEKKLAEIVCVEPSRVQIIKPLQIKHGFELNVNFYFLDVNKTPIDYYNILVDAQQKKELQTAFQEGWKLQDQPFISIISHVTVQSKDARRRSQKTETQQNGTVPQLELVTTTYSDGSGDQTTMDDKVTAEEMP